jgi:glycosyltransferase involved in cell wall biosynthesis
MSVSVVIPALNAEPWIGSAIDSVLRQSYRNIEVIVIDDGSSDATPDVAERILRDAPFSYKIVRQRNAGAASARNAGWRAARGKWIQFLDADDLLEPWKIELQVAAALQQQAGNVFYSDWQKLIQRDGEWIKYDIRAPILQNDAIADLLSDRNFLQLGCLLFQSEILEIAGGFDQEHEPIEDVGMCVKIAGAGGVFVKVETPGPSSYYRDLPQSFSKRGRRRFIEACIRNASLAEKYIDADDPSYSRVVRAIVEVYYSGTRFYAGNDWRRFDELFSDIKRLQPNFSPRTPRLLSVLTRLVGYRSSEHIAVLYRRGKGLFTGRVV